MLIRSGAAAACPGRPVLVRQASFAAIAAISVTLLAQSLGLIHRAMAMPGMSMGPGMALRMAVFMTLVGVLIPRPAHLTAWSGLARLGLWIIGLALFALIDARAMMAAMAMPDAATAAALAMAPLFIGLLLTIVVRSGERCCIGFMLIMTHFSLMAWPWLGLCAVLGALGDNGLCRLIARAR